MTHRETWKPMYPGQKMPQWREWDNSDPELGLLGFLTRQDRDDHSAGRPGPYRRIVAPDGRTTLQNDDFHGMVRRLAHDAGIS